MQSYYAARAPGYDAVYQKPERQADLRAIESWLPPRFAGRSVLEVACGTGYWTQFIAPNAAAIVAMDSAPETLRIAASRIAVATVRFITGDAWMLPPDLGTFDAAFAGFWFSHVPRNRRREFLLGLGRHLRPGARVVLLDNRYVEGSSSRITEQDTDGDTWQTRTLVDGSTYRVLKNFPTESELQTAIAGLGTHGALALWPHYWVFEYVAVRA
ncbi:class I SAM-dependent methyltransferase [Metallibacterium sp.]|nr:class I SAM-dependent methyltransferase [Metallibacterium sp.]